LPTRLEFDGHRQFPLITNDREMDAEQLLRVYKRQPLIERRVLKCSWLKEEGLRILCCCSSKTEAAGGC
jgi:hypothetical protein